MKQEKLAIVVWKDITLLDYEGLHADYSWDSYLVRMETVGYVSEKDGVVKVVCNRETENVVNPKCKVFLIPESNVLKIIYLWEIK